MACPWCTMPGGKHEDGCPYEDKPNLSEVRGTISQMEILEMRRDRLPRSTVEEMRDAARDLERHGLPANASTLREGANRILELQNALRSIKTICAGDRNPHWTEDMHTVTVTRGRIMDICEIADQK